MTANYESHRSWVKWTIVDNHEYRFHLQLLLVHNQLRRRPKNVQLIVEGTSETVTVRSAVNLYHPPPRNMRPRPQNDQLNDQLTVEEGTHETVTVPSAFNLCPHPPTPQSDVTSMRPRP